VGRDRVALLGGELAVLVDDVEQRLGDLADVVEQRDALDHVVAVRRQLGGAARMSE
jgi:hypothetical protein